MEILTDWREDCPKRGAALKHAHWSDCRPPAVHPGTDEVHEYRQCCHCLGMFADEKQDPNADVEMREAGIPPEAEVADDPGYASTAPGVTADEPDIPPFDADCGHKVLVDTPLVGDDGLEWPTCGDCGVMKEPKLALGYPVGPADSPSRGWVSPRIKAKWETVRKRWLLFG